jgi:hypothetical protein
MDKQLTSGTKIETLTDAQAKEVKAKGLSIVFRPSHFETARKVGKSESLRLARAFTSAETH